MLSATNLLPLFVLGCFYWLFAGSAIVFGIVAEIRKDELNVFKTVPWIVLGFFLGPIGLAGSAWNAIFVYTRRLWRKS